MAVNEVKVGELKLKTINNQKITGTGNIEIPTGTTLTTKQITDINSIPDKQDKLTPSQLIALENIGVKMYTFGDTPLIISLDYTKPFIVMVDATYVPNDANYGPVSVEVGWSKKEVPGKFDWYYVQDMFNIYTAKIYGDTRAQVGFQYRYPGDDINGNTGYYQATQMAGKVYGNINHNQYPYYLVRVNGFNAKAKGTVIVFQ